MGAVPDRHGICIVCIGVDNCAKTKHLFKRDEKNILNSQFMPKMSQFTLFSQVKLKELLTSVRHLTNSMSGASLKIATIFTGPRSDHSLCMSVTYSLTSELVDD